MINYDNKFKNNIFTAVITLIVFLIFTFFLISPDKIREGTEYGLQLIYHALIPATFPYLVLGSFLISSGAADYLGSRLNFLSKLFNISPCSVFIIILGMLSGFPSGAVYSRQLYQNRKIDKNEAERLTAFCNLPSPAFIITFLGMNLTGHIIPGIIFYILQVIFALVFGIVLGKMSKNKNSRDDNPNLICDKESGKPLAQALCESIAESGITAVKIYSFVLFFALLSHIINTFSGHNDILKSALAGIFEISSGMYYLEKVTNVNLAYLLGCSILSFSGLSVLMQVKSAAKGLDVKKFVFGKLISTVTLPLISFALYRLFLHLFS